MANFSTMRVVFVGINGGLGGGTRSPSRGEKVVEGWRRRRRRRKFVNVKDASVKVKVNY
jgi:hypothetical protein